MKKIRFTAFITLIVFTSYAKKNAKLEAVSGTYTIGGTRTGF